MTYRLSFSTRLIIAGLLVVGLFFQCTFSTALLAGHLHAHNGRITLANGNWNDALWYYTNANRWFPHNHQWLYSQAAAQLNLQRTGDAVLNLDQALKQAPHYGAALSSLGHEMVKSGNVEMAESLAGRGMALTPEFWSYHYLEALTAIARRDHVAAADALTRARHHSMTPVAQVLRTSGQLSFAMKDLVSARYAVEQGIRVAPDMPELWQLRGQIVHTNDELDEGIVSYRKALTLYRARIDSGESQLATDPKRWGETSAYAGVAFAQKEDDERALTHFGNAVSQYIALTVFADSVLDVHERIAAGLEQTTPAAQFTWANVLASAGHFDLATRIFTRLEELPSESFPDLSRYYFAQALHGQGDTDAALNQFQKMNGLNWNHALAHGDMLVAAGRPAAASFEYNRMLSNMRMSDEQRRVVQQRLAASSQ